LTLDHVLDTLGRWALDQRSESLGIDDLVDLETASITCILGNLDAWLDIGASGDDTLDADEGTDLIGLDLSHEGESHL